MRGSRVACKEVIAMCPRAEKLRMFLLGLGIGLLASFLVCAWFWKLLLAAGLIAIALLMDC